MIKKTYIKLHFQSIITIFNTSVVASMRILTSLFIVIDSSLTVYINEERAACKWVLEMEMYWRVYVNNLLPLISSQMLLNGTPHNRYQRCKMWINWFAFWWMSSIALHKVYVGLVCVWMLVSLQITVVNVVRRIEKFLMHIHRTSLNTYGHLYIALCGSRVGFSDPFFAGKR